MTLTLLLTVFLGLLLTYLVWILVFKTKKDREYDKLIEESLEDEYIIDPETGVKMTLEQAESGHWIEHDNEFLVMPEEEIEKLFDEEEKEVQRALNYLKEQRQYRKHEFTSDHLEILEKSKMLGKYDNWTYSDSFRIEYCDGFIFLPAVELNGHSRTLTYYNESQCMFWLILDVDLGHYYLREKSLAEKFFDLIKNDDDLKLENYESFTFEKTDNILFLIKILKHFEGQKGLEIEFMGHNLFIKNLKYINLEDLKKIEGIVKTII